MFKYFSSQFFFFFFNCDYDGHWFIIQNDKRYCTYLCFPSFCIPKNATVSINIFVDVFIMNCFSLLSFFSVERKLLNRYRFIHFWNLDHYEYWASRTKQNKEKIFVFCVLTYSSIFSSFIFLLQIFILFFFAIFHVPSIF